MADKTIDRPDVTEQFADHCERVMFDGQTLRVDLAVTRYDAKEGEKRPSAQRVLASRLVLTPTAALQLHNQLARVVAALEEKGIVKKAGATQTKQ